MILQQIEEKEASLEEQLSNVRRLKEDKFYLMSECIEFSQSPLLICEKNISFFPSSIENTGFPGGSVVKNPPVNVGDQVRSLDQEDPLKKEMATHSSILAWKIPQTEEPGGPQLIGLQIWAGLSK